MWLRRRTGVGHASRKFERYLNFQSALLGDGCGRKNLAQTLRRLADVAEPSTAPSPFMEGLRHEEVWYTLRRQSIATAARF